MIGRWLVLLIIVISGISARSTSGKLPDDGDKGLYNDGLLQGDIIGTKLEQDRNSFVDTYKLWPGGVVYFQLDETVVNQSEIIKEGMNEYHQKTCVKFVERTPENAEEIKDYILIVNPGGGCSSSEGRIGGEQTLSLGPECNRKGLVMHELMHAIGFHHEQNRSDRDDFVDIKFDNIQEAQHYNFDKVDSYENNLLNETFDFESIMMYEWNAWALNWSLPTIVPKGRPDLELGPVYLKTGFSDADVRRINKLYECFGMIRPPPPDIPDTVCDFETDDCGIVNQANMGSYFERTFMELGERIGNFLVLQTETGKSVGARLYTPFYRVYSRNVTCLSFDYYMAGSGVKSFEITQQDKETHDISNLLHTAREWVRQKVTLNTTGLHDLRFILTVILDFNTEGIVAVDNIAFSRSPCKN